MEYRWAPVKHAPGNSAPVSSHALEAGLKVWIAANRFLQTPTVFSDRRPAPDYGRARSPIRPTAKFAEIRSSSTRNRGTTLPASRCADGIGKVHLDVRVRD